MEENGHMEKVLGCLGCLCVCVSLCVCVHVAPLLSGGA